MRVYKPLDHSAFPIPDCGHTDAEVIDADSKLLAAPNILRDLRRMNDILTWQTCDVRAGPTNILAFHRGDALSPSCEGPGQKLRAGTATKDEEIVIFWLFLSFHRCCSPS